MIKTIALVVVLLIAAVLIFAATRPDTFRVQRAASIKAPPEKIFPLINDFQSWGAWSPWEKRLWTRIVFKQGKVAERPLTTRRVGDQETAETASPTARRLNELKLLLDRGLITDKEYQEKRKAILQAL